MVLRDFRQSIALKKTNFETIDACLSLNQWSEQPNAHTIDAIY